MPQIKHGPVRARDLRANIARHGFEQGVTRTLELLLEEHAETKQNMRDLAAMVSQCIDQVTAMVNFGDLLRKRMDEYTRLINQGGADGQQTDK